MYILRRITIILSLIVTFVFAAEKSGGFLDSKDCLPGLEGTDDL